MRWIYNVDSHKEGKNASLKEVLGEQCFENKQDWRTLISRSTDRSWAGEQLIRWADMEYGEQVSRWAGEQVSRWAGEQVSRWAGEQVSRWASRWAGEHRWGEQVSRWAGEQVSRWAGEHVSRWAGEPGEQVSRCTVTGWPEDVDQYRISTTHVAGIYSYFDTRVWKIRLIDSRCVTVTRRLIIERHQCRTNIGIFITYRWLEENCVCRSDPTTKWERLEEEEKKREKRRREERRNFYLKSNRMVNTTLANSLLRRLHTQYVQHNIQYRRIRSYKS